MFPERIETDRLVLERLSHENLDLFEFYEICSDADGEEAMAEVTEYMPWDPHETVGESREFVDRCEKQWDEGEAVTYAIRPREGEDGAGAFAGAGGLTIDWDRRTGTLGTWLRKRFWGRGYSGERAAALIELAFDRLDLEVVAVTHHADNAKSRHAVENYVEAHGGRREGLLRNWLPYDEGVADEYRYTITQDEYLNATG
ncbi:GNAT family N-acetyltransferase [Halococcus thailandensis]|uniref:GCN5-related N-acetyltransferase n=1 Tax=Halococcus thailandensis JCM 13552 TaxID=1227457 RepID=M0N018_9EURY|nr:GNAT family protein [Halococcus thailandensis]EMA51211.1 GCN5-related N-acetyltransferase [Halococcus thailandensis JCM 13552]